MSSLVYRVLLVLPSLAVTVAIGHMFFTNPSRGIDRDSREEIRDLRLEVMCAEQLKQAVEQEEHSGRAKIGNGVLESCQNSTSGPYLQLIEEGDKEFTDAISDGKVEIYVHITTEDIEAMEGE